MDRSDQRERLSVDRPRCTGHRRIGRHPMPSSRTLLAIRMVLPLRRRCCGISQVIVSGLVVHPNDELLDRDGVRRLIGALRKRLESRAWPCSRSLLAMVMFATPFANDAEKLAGSTEASALDPERSVEVRVELAPRRSGRQADQGHAIVEAAACGSGAGIGSAVRVDGDEDDVARGQHRGGRQGHLNVRSPCMSFAAVTPVTSGTPALASPVGSA